MIARVKPAACLPLIAALLCGLLPGCAAWRRNAALNQGQRLLELGREEEAKVKFRQAAAAAPDDLLVQSGLGWAALETSDYQQAAASFQKITASAKRRPDLAADARQGLAALAYARKEFGDAWPLLTDALNETPAWMTGRSMAGWTAYFLSMFQEARRNFDRVLEEIPGDLDARRGRGLASYKLGDWNSARRDLRWASEHAAPEQLPSLLVEWAWVEYYSGDWAAAAACFQRALAEDGALAEAEAGLGWCALRQGRQEEARQAFESSLRKAPGLAAALMGLQELRGE